MPRLSPWRELTALYLVTVLVTVAFTIFQGIAWVGAYGMIAVAAVFLYLPIEVLERQGIAPSSFGIHRRQPVRAAKWALLAMLISFPPFLVGNYVWATQVADQRLDLEGTEYARFSEVLAGRPSDALGQNEARLFIDDADLVWYEWRFEGARRVQINVTSDQPLDVVTGRHLVTLNGDTTTFTGVTGGRIAFRVAQRFSVSAVADDQPVPASALKLGATEQPAEERPYEAERGWWWLLNLILGQLLVVALPEEVFYRGYLQGRLDQLIGRERKIFGVEINPLSVVVTSALFAVGHFATIPAPYRLAVFFPSLAFGWLRRASGGVLAPVLFHASCNVIARLASLHYQ